MMRLTGIKTSYCARYLAGMLLAIISSASYAAVFDSIIASPSSSNISQDRFISLPITWRISSSHPVTATLQLDSGSQSLWVEDNLGNLLLTPQSAVFSRSVTLPASSSVITSFSESIVIPPDVIYRARQNRANRLIVRRQFSGTLLESGGKPAPILGSATGMINLNITTSASTTSVIVTRAYLSFENGQISRSLALNSRLRARLEINSSGTGLLRGVWEIAEPVSTRAAAIYRPLQQWNQQVVGDQVLKIQSPELPSGESGLYLLRFRFTEPLLESEMTIRYQISEQDAVVNRLRPVTPVQPVEGAYIDKNTEFSWKPVDDAKYYQLEFYLDSRKTGGADGKPEIEDLARVTGILVPGDRRSQLLTELARQNLRAGKYYWSVVAINSSGHRVAASELRTLQVR